MSEATIRRCILKMNDPVIGDYFVCEDCKHFMLSSRTAELQIKCTKRLLTAFEPPEEIYRCLTCGRYFDTREQWAGHDDIYTKVGDYDPHKFVYSIDENNFVQN